MAENSKIEWTHHTFNPWWGCVRVSPACEHCYAEAWSKRVGFSIWGKRAPRRMFGDAHWREPLKWHREARERGNRSRVFCASMADVFEARADLDAPRARLWKLIEETPSLDWLLLTKRPENISRFAPWGGTWPRNIWLGTTVENATYTEKRIPMLLAVAAHVHFLSCEPLLGPLDLSKWLSRSRTRSGASASVDWVIVGGESGGGARAMDPAWARALRDQCRVASVPFHFKQWGEWAPVRRCGEEQLVRLGKRRAGRVLDGLAWDGFPSVTLADPCP